MCVCVMMVSEIIEGDSMTFGRPQAYGEDEQDEGLFF